MAAARARACNAETGGGDKERAESTGTTVKIHGNFAIDPAGKILKSVELAQLPSVVQHCDHQWSGLGSNKAANRLTCTACGLRAIKYHTTPPRCVWMIVDLKLEKAEREAEKVKKAQARQRKDATNAELVSALTSAQE